MILLVLLIHSSLSIHVTHQKRKSPGLMSWVFANDLGDRGSIPGRVIPKTQKMVLDAAWLSIQHYKVRNKGEVEQSRERSSALSYASVLYLLKMELLSHPRLRSPTIYELVSHPAHVKVLVYIYIYISGFTEHLIYISAKDRWHLDGDLEKIGPEC